MAKLALTGGGRCNISNTFRAVEDLSEVYPRGSSFMKRALHEFGPRQTEAWFGERGVPLSAQEDGRLFPRSGKAQDVVDCLARSMQGTRVRCNSRIASLDGVDADYAVITTGGGGGMEILWDLPVDVQPPVPSLFSFNLPPQSRDELRPLMGISTEAALSIPGTGFRSKGSLLITDWGFSGPAALKLSSFAARHLAGCAYRAPLLVNWAGCNEEQAALMLGKIRTDFPRRQLGSVHPDGIASRLWEYLLRRAGADPLKCWGETGRKELNRIRAVLTADSYSIAGKNRFKDEFVTCGGVDLHCLTRELECRRRQGLFFAGEVLDIDAVTGGFNLQAAWTTGWTVAKAIIGRINNKQS